MSLSSKSQISFDFTPSRFTSKVIIATITLILTGSLNTILFKLQTKNFGLKQEMISIQTFFMFIGQYLNLIYFYLKILLVKRRNITHFRKYKNRALMSAKKFNFNPLKIGIASIINCIASLMYLYAFYVLPPTMFQMILGSVIIFTPLLSWIFLKKKLYPHTIVGIIFTIIALVSICFSTLVLNSTIGSNSISLQAILLMIGGLFLTSCQRVYEEYLLKKIETSAFRFIGLEGLYGICFLGIIHVIFFIVYLIFPDFKFFNAGNEIKTILENKNLLISSIVLIVSFTFCDLCGIILTKKVSATFRVVNEVLKVFFIWIVEIFLYDITNGINNKTLYILVTIWRLISYSILIFGNILINEITGVPFLGLDKYFGRYNQNEDTISDETEDYTSI